MSDPRCLERRDGDAALALGPVHRRTLRAAAWRVERLLEVVVSGVALVLLSPVLVAVALAVRCELGPGVIVRQERVGTGGRRFALLGFRSMPHPGPGDPRHSSLLEEDLLGEDLLGPVGRFIRTYSLDQVPQLFNVLAGHLSLVGSRPVSGSPPGADHPERHGQQEQPDGGCEHQAPRDSTQQPPL